ncbi:hypothetical protein ACP4OV_022918 [Aristida adscensionis]
MFAAARGRRELVEILFPWTKPIPSIPGWSVDGIIRTMKWWRFLPQDTVLVEQQIADAKSQGKEAFAKGEYYTALHFYGLARDKNPLDATLFSNMSLCWLRLRDGDQALLDARRCKMMRPRWSKAWYREGAALSMLKKYKGAVDAFLEALKLHPANDEIKEALREDGRTPIMFAAARGRRELVEILFPWTKPIPSIPDWSVDGIIRTMKWWRFLPQDTVLVEQQIADAKSQGKEAFAKGEYYTALHFYGLARDKNPLDATLFANMSLCWLRLRNGDQALLDARRCKMMRPRWSKAWYREGAALNMLKKYKGAADAFMEALKLDPANDKIKKASREAMEAMKTAARFKE